MKTKSIKAFNIKYETDGVKVKLPKSIIFQVEDEFDPEMQLADLISDKTGWLVISCDFKWK